MPLSEKVKKIVCLWIIEERMEREIEWETDDFNRFGSLSTQISFQLIMVVLVD